MSKPVHVLVTGGGSGGHITPVLAVAHQLRQLEPDCIISYVSQTGDSLADVPAADPSIHAVYTVRAGKFRRYHGAGWRQLFDIPTIAKNVRDGLYVLVGVVQSYFLLRRLRPQIIFTRGSFVSVPVCLAAAWLRIPYVTHDSDAIPSLANRLIARWARLHAVALPKEVYRYPADKTISVGVPISHNFHAYSPQELQAARERTGLQDYTQVLLLTGGGLGADRLNQALAAVMPKLLAAYPKLAVVQLAGRKLQTPLQERYQRELAAADLERVKVEGFVRNLYDYSALSNVVITRAGGNSMAEFAAQAKACIVVPNPELTGGHQTKNAQVLAGRQAVVLVEEPRLAENPEVLLQSIRQLLDHPEEAIHFGKQLQAIAHPDAAKRLAMVLLKEARQT